jgi:hypothetical protein
MVAMVGRLPIDLLHAMRAFVRSSLLLARGRAGQQREGAVRDCPLKPEEVRSIWHTGGTPMALDPRTAADTMARRS